MIEEANKSFFMHSIAVMERKAPKFETILLRKDPSFGSPLLSTGRQSVTYLWKISSNWYEHCIYGKGGRCPHHDDVEGIGSTLITLEFTVALWFKCPRSWTFAQKGIYWLVNKSFTSSCSGLSVFWILS